MKLKLKNTMASTLGALALMGVASSVLATPEGIGDCHLQDGNWFPGAPMAMTGWIGHPCAQLHPNHYPPAAGGYFGSTQTSSTLPDGTSLTRVVTPEGQHAPVDNQANPPGSNFLMNVDSNLYDFLGNEMPNTLPSRLGDDTYLLHEGPVTKTAIDQTSPSDDLDMIIDHIEKAAKKGKKMDDDLVEFALDILEGNQFDDDYASRAYQGFPMLHYNGPNKHQTVTPIYADDGVTVVGGNIDVELIYWDQHIEGDTSLINPAEFVAEVPWTITYNVNILHGGIEDFSPMVMNFDRSPADTRGPFHASMDQSYFPMLEEGQRYTVKIKETKGKYYNLTYIWGWRIHPPRVQVIENATKMAGPMNLLQHEQAVFGMEPTANEANKLAAIAMIGDLSPAKRMWNIFRSMQVDDDHGRKALKHSAADLRAAFLDWSDRTKLPAGVKPDPDSTITLLYVNNTIYGSRQGLSGTGPGDEDHQFGDDSGQGPAAFKGICNGCAHDWSIRPYNFRVRLFNGDHFPHGYVNVDFGGTRGWENHYQNTDPTTALATYPNTDPTFIQGERTDIVDGEVVVSNGNFVDTHVLLDNTPNAGKQALRTDLSTGETIVTNDRIFPMNSGGPEEYLLQSPRNPDDIYNGKPLLGSGCFFTFGRHHAWPSAGGPWGPIVVPPVQADGTPSTHVVEIEYNFEPSRRLKIYQFDPLHHDVAVYSLH